MREMLSVLLGILYLSPRVATQSAVLLGQVVVCPSVLLSARDVDVSWWHRFNSSKIISWLLSPCRP